MKKFNSLLLAITCFLTVACSTTTPKATTIEVTKVVEVPVTQIVTVEVTRLVEVTRVVEKEITKVVPMPPTVTPTPKEIDPNFAFSMNYLGAIEQDGIKVEFARIIIAQRNALKPNQSFDDISLFDGNEYVCEIIWRISNNTDQNIKWSYDDINVRVNDRQIKLYDYLFYSFGEMPGDPIFPGSTIIGGVWFGIGNIKPNTITSVSLLMGSPHDSDTYHKVSSSFIISADLSGEHKWYPLPDDLK